MKTSPQSERLHICLYGRRNSGKSSLINVLVGQEVSLVSPSPGTTTDPVSKAVELGALGPCLLVDTAGYDDEGPLGQQRVARSLKSLDHCDLAVLLIEAPLAQEASTAPQALELERQWCARIQERSIPLLVALSKSELSTEPAALSRALQEALSLDELPLAMSSQEPRGLEQFLPALVARQAEMSPSPRITRGLVGRGDTVLLVMPQDRAAPRGRLILPQVQTLRELLDLGCHALCCTPEELSAALGMLREPPRLIITDAQAFAEVEPLCPETTMLTSFSILMAGYKGDLPTLIAGARTLEGLKPNARILIAEACSHAPQTEDIGRVKIPALLRRRYGEGLTIEIFSGADYPQDLTQYDLIIHCGGCMLNRRHMLTRLDAARQAGVGITNYGICMAYLGGILGRIAY